MEARLTEINKNEVLMYLGFRGGEISSELDAQIDGAIELIKKTARPRVLYRIFDLLPDGTITGTDFQPKGNDIKELLKDSSKVILMAATLGMEIETLLRRTQVTNMTDALILDCCGSSAIENVCDNLCDDLAEELCPLHLTDRFSPGYGDLPFEQQKELCAALELQKRLGVSLSESGLMIPQKSVTAIIGISDTPQKRRFRGCARCNNFKNCDFRKEGKTCGNF